MAMHVTLTPELESFIHQEVQTGMYASASDVIRASLCLLQETKARKPNYLVSSIEELEEKLVEGLDSGPATEMTAADWKSIRSQVEQRIHKPTQ